jgi:peptide/nickel transport system substrate-binding protein
VSEWVLGESLILEAVPDYWNGRPAYPRLVFQVAPDETDRLDALRQGEADLVTDLSTHTVNDWDDPDSQILEVDSTQRLLIGIRAAEAGPLADKRVRQALNYAVNVEQLINTQQAGYGTPYGSWINPPSTNPELEPWPYSPALAIELLTEAGYGTGFTTTLRTPVGVYNQDAQIADEIARQLSEIGVQVQVETEENWGIYVRELLTDTSSFLFLITLNSRGDGLEDAKNLSAAFRFNPTGWQNNFFEGLLTQAVNTFNESSRTRLLNELQQIAYEDAPWIWLWRPHHFYGIQTDFDWQPRRDGLIYLYKPAARPNTATDP